MTETDSRRCTAVSCSKSKGAGRPRPVPHGPKITHKYTDNRNRNLTSSSCSLQVLILPPGLRTSGHLTPLPPFSGTSCQHTACQGLVSNSLAQGILSSCGADVKLVQHHYHCNNKKHPSYFTVVWMNQTAVLGARP